VNKANIRIFLTLIEGFLRNKGKITVRSVSRYCPEYSLRQILRFFGVVHKWIEISVLVFKEGLYQKEKKYLIAIDETVIEKSGRHTHGKYGFYSSVYQQVVFGIAFMALSLIDVEKRKSYSIAQEQVIVSETDKNKAKARKSKKRSERENSKVKRGRGRPKGSKNKDKVETDTPAYRTFKILLEKVFSVFGRIIPQLTIKYAVLDSAYAAATFVQTLQQYGLAIISKLSADAVLYLPAKPSPTKKRGRPAKYGQKIKLADIDNL
ncbi:MAG: transposase, partial [Bacteroidia bacterium]|nr:transposase [Bacteroidia bacterium]